jgi:hypothetical protein
MASFVMLKSATTLDSRWADVGFREGIDKDALDELL